MNKKFIFTILTALILCNFAGAGGYYTHYRLRSGVWRGDLMPEQITWNYLTFMQVPAVIAVDEYYRSTKPYEKGCFHQTYWKATPWMRAFGMQLEQARQKAYRGLFSRVCTTKKLKVRMENGYKVIAVAKYIPYLECSVLTNDAFPAVFPAILQIR